jgi:hypothetical protein
MGSLNTTQEANQEANIEPGLTHQTRFLESHKRLLRLWLPDRVDSIPIASRLSSMNCIRNAQALTEVHLLRARRFECPAD